MYLIFILLVSSLSAASAFLGHGFPYTYEYRRNMISNTALSSNGNISTSSRIQETLDPCVVLMKQIIERHQHLWEDNGGIYSLAQGVVYWKPPSSAYEAMQDAIKDPDNPLHSYTLDEGLPSLISALGDKLSRENKLAVENTSVIVTSGANQAYMNCVLTFMSEGDLCVVFKPYYFNHVMAIQMTRGQGALLVGPIDDDGIPSTEWLRDQLESNPNIKMVTITNPGNPTGISIPTEKLEEIIELCRLYDAWVIFDCTYEQFDHTGENSFLIDGSTSGETGFKCFGDEHVINIFSFSKGYAMAGFRVGYVAVNTQQDKGKDAFSQMVKVQDTIPICTSRITQHAALGALIAGRSWVLSNVQTLETGRKAILDALSPLEKTIGGTGAMYCMAKLPDGINDMDFAEELVEKYGIAVIPGVFCGLPGWIRVCYSNLATDECLKAAARLKKGISGLSVDK